MAFESLAKLRPQIKYRFWACIGHEGQTLDDLEEKMLELGNRIIEVDEENQRILVAQIEESGGEQWGCRICLAEGSLVIVDSEAELTAHCDLEHEGWRNE